MKVQSFQWYANQYELIKFFILIRSMQIENEKIIKKFTKNYQNQYDR